MRGFWGLAGGGALIAAFSLAPGGPARRALWNTRAVPPRVQRVGPASLSGIPIPGSSVATVIEALGPPGSFTDWPGWEDSGAPPGGDRQYYWTRGGVRTEITSEYYGEPGSAATVETLEDVVAMGSAAVGDLGVTNRGLRLGDSEARSLQLYGEPAHRMSTRLWAYRADGAELTVLFDFAGRIVAMEMTSEEAP